jgi:hypothetical protein
MAGRRRRGEDGVLSPRDYEGGSPYLDEWEQSQERLAIANPFLGASVGFGPLSPRGQAATKAYEEESARLPNVLVRPPSDFGAMTTERQLAWQQNLKAQQELETGLLQSESARRQQELEDISRKEGLELIRQSADLDPKDPDYHVKKNALIRQFPRGARSEDAKVILTDLDESRKVVENASEEERKAIANTERTRGEGNFGVARTQAAELGPDFLGQFLEISKSQSPEAAIAYVAREGARRKQEALTTQMRERGVPEEQIARYGKGTPEEPFQFPAAEAGAKDNYRKEITSLFTKLRSEKQKWEGDLLHRNTPFPDEEDFQSARAEFNRVMGNKGRRGGIEGVINPRASAPAGNQPQFPAGSRQAAQYNPPTGPVTMPAQAAPAQAVPTPAPTPGVISATEASAQAGRPIAPGTVLKDKYGNRVLVR